MTQLRFVEGTNRFPLYLSGIKEALDKKLSAIVLLSDINLVQKTKEIIEKDLNVQVFIAYRGQKKEAESWQRIRQAENCVVLGTRSAIFAPVRNLGLIIIDQESDPVYKQEQVPHYHAREAALMRAEIEQAKVILGGNPLSLESFFLARQNNLEYEYTSPKKNSPEIKLIDPRRKAYSDKKAKPVFSRYLEETVYSIFLEKGKTLLFINRKGFATSAYCHNCGVVLKCPRCNINLVFHFDENRLKCHHCNFGAQLPKICPSCKAGYIKYSGLGVEKVESELSRIMPQARIKTMDDLKNGPVGFDILISTSSVLKREDWKFDLTGILGIDNSLNRVDFRAGEKTFILLSELADITSKKMVIETANPRHHCFEALVKNDRTLFFKKELAQRKQLNFPPFKHVVILKIRGKDAQKVKTSAQDLFESLAKIKTSALKLVSLSAGNPPKLRGNFYYQILCRASSAPKASSFLKINLKERHYSGIIITVDVDPLD